MLSKKIKIIIVFYLLLLSFKTHAKEIKSSNIQLINSLNQSQGEAFGYKNKKLTNHEEFIILDLENKNCLEINISLLDHEKFLIQVTNLHSDLYFYKVKKCWFQINEDKLDTYSFTEVELNAIDKLDTRSHEFLKFNSFRMNTPQFRSYYLSRYEIKTFLVEKIK